MCILQCIMSHGRGKKGKRHKKNKYPTRQTESSPAEQPSTPLASTGTMTQKTDWFGVVVPLLISFGLTIIIINNDAPGVLIVAWLGVTVAIAWSLVKLLKRFPWAWWKKSIPIGFAMVIVFCVAYWDIGQRLRPSFVFVIPGVLLNGDTWDFIVNHRGPKTGYNAQILFVDDDRLEYLRRTTKTLSPQDLNSYQLLLSLPEVNPKGRGTIFAKQFQWKPFSLANSHFTAEITWRDGAAHEEIHIVRVQDKWKYAISLNDRETGKSLVHCKDDGFPSLESLPACFPGINDSD